MIKLHILALLLGFCMDLCFGDPHWLPHPVRLIGWWVSKLEKLLRGWFPRAYFKNHSRHLHAPLCGIFDSNSISVAHYDSFIGAKSPTKYDAHLPESIVQTRPRSDKGELAAGALLVLMVVVPTGAFFAAVLWGAYQIGPFFYLAAESIMIYQLLAVKSLKDESMKVYTALKAGDILKARYAVSMIVGRDTENLTDIGITKAAVETVAENTSDGAIAPLLYAALGGPVLGYLYKAINTMDSMVGYKNEKYLYFGRSAAKLDDLVNFIPSRIAALLMILTSFLTGQNGRHAWQIFQRDRFCHKSPNSAQTEAVCAGALDIQLAGDAWYFGTLQRKPVIGDAVREAEYEDIRRANRLLYGTAVIALVLVELLLAAASISI